jgi:hypothetical protein
MPSLHSYAKHTQLLQLLTQVSWRVDCSGMSCCMAWHARVMRLSACSL